MAQTAPQFDWESARPVEEEPQVAAAPPATDDTYPGAPLNDPAAQSPGTVSEVMFDWESARPVEARPEFDLESAQPLRELAKDPAYLMSREQYRAYREETKEDNNEVGEFLSGIPGVIPGLYAMGAGTVGELGQQVAQNWYRPDKLVASLAANANEGVRRQALFYGKLVDYVGRNLRDSDIQRKREAAYGEQIRLRMQQEGKLSGDPVRDHETVMQALFAAKESGEIPLADAQLAEDEERAYQDYWRGKAFDQSMANITEINVAGAPATVPDSRFVGRNMVTGEVVLPGEFSPDVVGMAVDPANILAVGIGSVARVDALRRAGILLGKGLKPTGEVLSATGGAITRGADAITERIQLATGGQRVGDKVVGGLSREAQTYGGAVAAGAVGYVTGGDTIIDQGMTGALALLPSMRLAGATLRRAGATAGAGWVVTNEMAAGPMSAARAETAEKLAGSGAIPERYSRFFRGEGRASADSTLRRVAQDQANPALLRSLAQFGDNVGLTKAVRATDDALGGALGGAAVTAPFALGASDPEMAGNIVGAGIVLGGAGGLVGGKLTRMSQMQDAMVARMLVDSEASGGNAAAFARAYSHGELTYMAGLQAFTRGKLKFVPLTTSEYRVNLDTKRRGGENTAGFHVEAAADGTQKVFINVGEPSAVAGEVVKIRAVTKGGKTIEVRGADGKSAFTYVPNEAKILVKQGDTVAAGDALTRNTSATLSVPEEIGHAIFSSNVMDGLPRDEMRNYINQRYKTEGVAQRGREYVSRLVDQEIAAGVHGAADNINDATRDRLIEDRFTEMSRASLEAGDDALDWARDEVIGATMRAATRGVDLNRLRNQSNFSRLAEQMVASSAQVLRVFGVDVDKMGRAVDPAGIFRDNPVFADPAMRRMVTKYMRDYDQWLAGMEQAGRKDRRGVRVAPSGRAEDLANSPHTVLREVKDANGNGTGVFENDVITRGPDGVVRPKKQADIDRTEVARSAQIKSLWDASKTVPTASTEFGKRRVNGRDVVGGPTLPPQWDLFTQFPQWIREFARQLEAGRTEGRTHVADYNAIGTGASGRYRVTNLGNIEAILREVAFVGWQITKKNHLLATVFDMNAFRAAAKRAIDNGELGEFGNNMDEVNATLLQYLDNHKNGRPGETGIGQTKKNILNGLIGTGTAKQSAANPFYSDLNPRGSVRTFRLDRLNDLRDTGRTGYNFMYEPINANMMPDAVPRASRGQAMPDTPANLTTDQILRELEENQGYLGLSTLGMREGRPVKGGAQQTRELLKRNTALNQELRRRGGTQEESDVERILRQRGQAMPDVADAPPFYLKSTQAIDAKVQGKAATPDQIKAILTNPQNGIKAEELKWTGVMQEVERLAKENNGKVPKDALLRYLAEDGAVRLEEVRMGETTMPVSQIRQMVDAGERIDVFDSQFGRAISYDDLGAYGPDERLTVRRDRTTKYGQYQLPGGENYREVVLAMPRQDGGQSMFNVYGPEDRYVKQFKTRAEAEAEVAQNGGRIKELFLTTPDQQNYTSSHFDTPNYVAHMRLNERVDAKGKLGLFIEELQSDRHQQGREKGYKDPDYKPPTTRADFEALGYKFTDRPDGGLRVDNPDGTFRQSSPSAETTMAGMRELGEQLARRESAGKVPDAPFRTSWPLQLFKRALRDAVADGKEWIGWTTGETQAARYDLSKQISEVAYNVDSQSLFAYDKKGENVLFQEKVTDQQIADYIGKEAAERLRNAPKEASRGGTMQRLKGEDLKVGGEGMKGFYDNMVPKEVAKYVKQWGGQVEKSKIKTPGSKKRVDDMSDAELVAELERGEDAAIWRVNITPQMREGIKKAGQALFVGGAAAVVAEDQLEQ